MLSTKKTKYNRDRSAAVESLVQPLPSSSIHDLPTDLMKNIFRFVGKGNYCFIGPVSRDFCFNYLTMDIAEESFEHKMEFQLAIQRNKVTTATAASTSMELAELFILNAPPIFQRDLCAKAALNGRLDILQMSDALGIDIKESSDEKVIVEVTKQGNLDVLKFLKEKACDFSSKDITKMAARHGHLDILKWMKSQGLIWEVFVFHEAARGGHLEIIEWGKDVVKYNFHHRVYIRNAAEGGHIELLKWFRSHGTPWDDDVFRCAAQSADISVLQYLFENGCPVTNDSLAYVFPFLQDDDTKVFETFRFLHQMGVPWDEQTSMAAGSRGILDVVVYARANGCPWNSGTLYNAVVSGNFDIVQYCLENHCPIGDQLCRNALRTPDHVVALKMLKLLRQYSVPWDVKTCTQAASNGNFEALKWARNQGCPWNEETFHNAIESEDIATIQYCIDNGCPFDNESYKDIMSQRKTCFQILKLLQKNGHEFTEDVCAAAASHGDIKVLRWLRYIGCHWDVRVCNVAVQKNNLSLLKYAYENGCPWTKHTFAYCFGENGLDGFYYPIPSQHICEDQIFNYLKENNCPMPEPNDWRLDGSDYSDFEEEIFIPLGANMGAIRRVTGLF